MGKRYGFDHRVLSETPNWRPTSRWQHRNDYVRWLREQGVHDHPKDLYGLCGKRHFVVLNRYKYLWFADTNEEQLFDLQEDPNEQADLSADETLIVPLRRNMATHLADWKGGPYDPRDLNPCCNQPPKSLFKS